MLTIVPRTIVNIETVTLRMKADRLPARHSLTSDRATAEALTPKPQPDPVLRVVRFGVRTPPGGKQPFSTTPFGGKRVPTAAPSRRCGRMRSGGCVPTSKAGAPV